MRTYITIIAALSLLLIGYGIGTRHMGATHAAIDAQNDATMQDLVTACETAQMNADEFYGKWLIAESNITTLTVSLGSAIDAIDAEGYDVAISDEGTVTISKPAPKPEPKVTPQVSRSTRQEYQPEYWSREKVWQTLQAAADFYEMDGWIVDKGASIAFKESTYNTHAVNGSHVGLFQFNADWGSLENRMDGKWSCYRFVKAYKDGGVENIKKHWKATY